MMRQLNKQQHYLHLSIHNRIFVGQPHRWDLTIDQVISGWIALNHETTPNDTNEIQSDLLYLGYTQRLSQMEWHHQITCALMQYE